MPTPISWISDSAREDANITAIAEQARNMQVNLVAEGINTRSSVRKKRYYRRPGLLFI